MKWRLPDVIGPKNVVFASTWKKIKMTGNEPKLRCAVILTAIPVEYKAVRIYLKDIREEVHPQGTVYERGKFFSSYLVWDVVIGEIGMGGLSAASEAERAMNYFKPDVVLFVGVAGGLKDVQRGDVVAATKVYSYEPGKVGPEGFEPRPGIGISTYRMEQRARAEARKEDWLHWLKKPPVARTPKVYAGPLVAGEKIIASKRSAVYQLLKTNYGDALAVEMEGHGFLHATHAYPEVETLIIRGISDLIDDKHQADAENGQEAAAQHASAFAFEILARLDVETWKNPRSVLSRFGAPFPDVWNVPRSHKAFFTGRDHILKRLYDGFTLDNNVGIIHPQAIDGLGGIGKTQTATEYAFRFRADYHSVVWARAATEDELLADYQTIARLLKRPEAHLNDRNSLIQTMMEWFMAQTEWLFILDNADDLALVEPFLPGAARGHILLTTRTQAASAIAQQTRLEVLDPDDGALCILRRAGIIGWNERLDDTSEAKRTAARTLSQLMDGLPLALEQAGAYINETGCGVHRYLGLYQNQEYQQKMLAVQSGPVPDYPEAVARAWIVSRGLVQRSNLAAADLLQLCAFLSPDAIPEEIFTRGVFLPGSQLQSVAADPHAFNLAIGVLRSYSLLNRDVYRDTEIPRLSMHRTMQEVLRSEMDEDTQRLWAEHCVRAVAHALPFVEWSVIHPHARICLQYIDRWQMPFDEAIRIRQRLEGN